MASKGGVIVVVSGEDKTGEVFAAIHKHMAETEAKAKSTSESLGGIGGALEHGLEAAGIAFSLREIVGGMKEMVTATMESAVELAHLNAQTGISVENLSVLKYAAKSTGVDFETLTKGFKKLSVTAYEADNGNKTAAKGFAQLGISADQLRAKGDDMYGVLTLIADKFHAMPAGINKSDAAAKIFGARMGSEMIPILDELGGKLDSVKAEAESLGVVWDEAGIKKMEAMHRSAAQLQGTMQGLAMKMTEALAPVLQETAKDLESVIKQLEEYFNLAGGSRYNSLLAINNAYGSLPQGALQDANFGKGSGTSKSSTQKQLNDLETSHAQRLISEKQYLERKAALQKQYDAADLLQNQAYFIALQKQISAKSSEIAHAKAAGINGPWSESEADAQKSYLAGLQSEEQRAAAAIASAQAKLTPAKPGPTGAPGDSAGGGSSARGAAADRSDELFALFGLPYRSKDILAAVQRIREAKQDLMSEQAAAFADAKAKMDAWIASGGAGIDSMQGVFAKAKMPTVTLAPQAKDNSAIDNEAEKFAHGLFDPLFNLGEKWDQQWKQIRANMLKDVGQTAESQLFGALFGDSSGKGGKGWDGSGGDGKSGGSGKGGHNGLLSQGLGSVGGLLGNLFSKKSGPVSNGTGAAGAGTVASAAASIAQIGKGAGTAGGGAIQVILNNTGTPQQVDSTQQSGGGLEGMVIQVMLKDLNSNGPMIQGIKGSI